MSSSKTSFTFENIVCTQIELQRRAASFSHRRTAMCRPASQYRLSLKSDNQRKLTKPTSTSSILLSPKSSTTERTSFSWDLSSNTFQQTKNKDTSQWSLDIQKSTPIYWNLRTCLIEEYTESESLIEFAKKTVLILMKTKEATIFLCLILIFPIIMIGIGLSHLDDCPRQTNLPIYLFVNGTVWTTKLLQNIWDKYRLKQKCLIDDELSADNNNDDGHRFIDGLLTLFLIIWFLFGQYWLIQIGYPPYFEQLLDNPDIWCHKTVVYCSFISIILTYFLVILFVNIIFFAIFLTRYTVIKRLSTS